MKKPTQHLIAEVPLSAPAAFAAADCTLLKSMTFPDATLTAAEAVTAGSLTLPGLESQNSLPAFCRVRVTLHPTTDSTMDTEKGDTLFLFRARRNLRYPSCR
jgi:hypothetical protein